MSASITCARTRRSRPASMPAASSSELLGGAARRQDVDVGEVAGCGPVEQRDHFAAGELVGRERRSDEACRGWIAGCCVDGKLDQRALGSVDDQPAEGCGVRVAPDVPTMPCGGDLESVPCGGYVADSWSGEELQVSPARELDRRVPRGNGIRRAPHEWSDGVVVAPGALPGGVVDQVRPQEFSGEPPTARRSVP